MDELNNLYLYRVKYSAIELPMKSRDVGLIISLIKLIYFFLYSLNIILLYYRIHLFLMVVLNRVKDNLIYFPFSSSPIS